MILPVKTTFSASLYAHNEQSDITHTFADYLSDQSASVFKMLKEFLAALIMFKCFDARYCSCFYIMSFTLFEKKKNYEDRWTDRVFRQIR